MTDDESAGRLEAMLRDHPDWRVLEMRDHAKGIEACIFRDYRSLVALGRRPGLFHLIGLAFRPGVDPYIRQLELTYFPPGTRHNADFEMRQVRWGGLMYRVATIPARRRPFAERLLDRFHLRIADGVPHDISASGVDRFPLAVDSAFTLEGGAGHPYAAMNAPGGLALLAAIDDAALAEIARRHREDPANN